jgi:hypothetical protein
VGVVLPRSHRQGFTEGPPSSSPSRYLDTNRRCDGLAKLHPLEVLKAARFESRRAHLHAQLNRKGLSEFVL